MRILQVLPTYDMGGPANVCFALSRGLVLKGIEVHILSLRPSDAKAMRRIAGSGIVVHDLVMGGLTDRAVGSKSREVMRQVQPQLVHCHGLRPDVLIAPVAKGLGIPVVSTIHSNLLDDYRMEVGLVLASAAYLVHRRALQRHHTGVAFISADAREHLISRKFWRLRHPMTRVIHNGIDIADFEAARGAPALPVVERLRADGSTLIGCVGSLIKRKDQASLLEAHARLLQMGHNCRVVLVGEGGQREALLERAQRLGTIEKVHLLGRQDDVPGVLRGIDVLVNCSLSEGLPLSVIEGAIAGLPVVATAVGGTPEIITEGETGLLVQPQAVDQLTSALDRLLSDRQFGQVLGGNARAYALQELTAATMAQHYLDWYLELLSQRNNAAPACEGAYA